MQNFLCVSTNVQITCRTSLVDKLHLFSLLHTHSQELPVEDPGKDIQQKPWAINCKHFYCVFIAFKECVFLFPGRAHTSQAVPMCKTATRLSADRLAAESPRVIHQSRVTMSHLCRGTILKRPGGGGGGGERAPPRRSPRQPDTT